MTTSRKARRSTRRTRERFMDVTERRLDVLYARALKGKRYDLTLESVKALARLYGLPID